MQGSKDGQWGVESLLQETAAEAFRAAALGRLAALRPMADSVVSSAGSVVSGAGNVVSSADSVVSSAGSVAARETLAALDELERKLATLSTHVSFMRNVHPDAALRTAAEGAEQEIARFATELSLRRDLYDAVLACEGKTEGALMGRLVKHMLRDFRRSGVDRDEATRRRVQQLRDEMVVISQEFHKNIVSDVRAVVLDGPEELAGLPTDYVQRHPPGPDGKVRITTDYPDYNPFMTYARSPRRRKELYCAFRLRAAPANLDILQRLLERRRELAGLLGFPSWAAYVTEDKMVRSPETVASFIERVSGIALPRGEREYGRLLERKRRDEPGASTVHDWEKAYYENLIQQEEFRVDAKAIRPYFPYRQVMDGALAFVEDLFGIEFRRATEVKVWHSDVEAYDVREGGALVGRIYLDMHPRESKFKHAAVFPLARGVEGRAIPSAALVCNFPRPVEGGAAALLEHSEVVTLFHEMGHLLHQLFSRDHEWAYFGGLSTEWDFVEVPSQLFEEFAWDHSVLSSFARHHESGEALPEEMVRRMREARDFGRGLAVRHQMYYASLSLRCHSADVEGLDILAMSRDLQNQYSLFKHVEETCFPASFGHLDDYSAMYYTYMWSLVIEKDLYGRLSREGVVTREDADRYRRAILAPGGSRDAADLVRDFLGREYGFSAFERWLDGAGDAATEASALESGVASGDPAQ